MGVVKKQLFHAVKHIVVENINSVEEKENEKFILDYLILKKTENFYRLLDF